MVHDSPLQDDRAAIDSYVIGRMDQIWEFSRYVWENPEVGYEEHKACAVQCELLKKEGFEVAVGVGGVETAFLATWGSGSPVIGVCSEYDALPGLGHACGHNLICATSVLTGMAVRSAMISSGVSGTIKIIGTPAEEGGGGKIRLLDAGVFDGVDAVFMMHPTSDKTRLAGACLSVAQTKIVFHGRPAQAASHPDRGRNALSAAELFLHAISLWREQFKGDVRASHIYVQGGDKTNTIPDEVVLAGNLRSLSPIGLRWVVNTAEECARHCAAAMGCTVDFSSEEGYQGRLPNATLSEACREEFESLGEPLLPGMPMDFGGEDIGNVSRVIPACCPYGTIFPEHKISGHTPQFREYAGSDAGRRCIEVSAKAMGRTIMRCLRKPGLLDMAKDELCSRLAKEEAETS